MPLPLCAPGGFALAGSLDVPSLLFNSHSLWFLHRYSRQLNKKWEIIVSGACLEAFSLKRPVNTFSLENGGVWPASGGVSLL
jgi:hypothetical protein